LRYRLNAKFLETHSISFIKLHIKEITDTKEFQSLPQKDLNKIMVLIEKIITLRISSLTYEGIEKDLTIELVTHNEAESFKQILLYIIIGSIRRCDYDMFSKIINN
ncbi:hypothetical protein DBV15_12461, partial [Temnothorax longispinosus]